MLPRTCPHCLIQLPECEGFSFDNDNNLICNGCGKPVFPTTKPAEGEVFQSIREQRTATICKHPARHDGTVLHRGSASHGGAEMY